MKKIEKRMMTTAMAELIFTDPDYLERGVPPSKLLKAMSTRENAAYSRKNLESIIQRELETGGLVRMENGNYTLGAGGDTDHDSMDIDNCSADSNLKMPSSNNSSSASSPLRVKGKPGRKKGSTGNKLASSQAMFVRNDVKKLMGIRVGERHKRAKKVFDPSDNNVTVVKKKRGRPLGTFKTAGKKLAEVQTVKPKTKSESGGDGDSSDMEDKDMIASKDKSSAVTGGVCSVCRQHKNAKDNSGKLVSCRDCSNKAHLSCLRGGDSMLRLRPDNTWQCPHCKTCVICIETNDAGLLTVCSVCSDAYHSLCHSPPIPEKFKAWDQWECRYCMETKNTHSCLEPSYIEKEPSDQSSKNSDRAESLKRNKSSNRSADSDGKNEKLAISEKEDRSYSPSSADNGEWKPKLTLSNNKKLYEWKHNGNRSSDGDDKRPKSQSNENCQPNKAFKPKSIYMDNYEENKWHTVSTYQKHPNDRNAGNEEGIDHSVPNAENWTNNDVYQYFSAYFPSEARAFKEQEIDGKALLLMRRNDLIHGFNLPLGPALKIYRHVVKLQTRKDDFSMCWV